MAGMISSDDKWPLFWEIFSPSEFFDKKRSNQNKNNSKKSIFYRKGVIPAGFIHKIMIQEREKCVKDILAIPLSEFRHLY